MSSRRPPPSRESFSCGRRGLVAAVMVALGATGASSACLSISPSPLPVASGTPTILHDAVIPTAGALLVDWPEDDTFIVPVDVGTSGEPFVYDVFVDYDPAVGGESGLAIPPTAVGSTPDSLDGGVFTVQFALLPPDPRSCHTIEVLVAHAFRA